MMSKSVREVEFGPSPGYGAFIWIFEGENSGITCEIEDVYSFWIIDLEPAGIRLEIEHDNPIIPSFLASFDVEPIFVVQAWIGKYNWGWSLRFANGKGFHAPTRLQRFVARRSCYREVEYEVRAGAPLPPLG